MGIATSAAVAAASGAVAAIAKILSSIGNIFGGNQKGAEEFSEGETTAANKEITETPAANSTSSPALPAVSTPTYVPTTSESTQNMTAAAQVLPESTNEVSVADSGPESDISLPVSTASTASTNVASTNTSSTATKDGFWKKNKKWLLPTVIGVGGIAAIAIGMKMLKPANKPVSGSLAGTPKKKKARKKNKRGKKKAVTLL